MHSNQIGGIFFQLKQRHLSTFSFVEGPPPHVTDSIDSPVLSFFDERQPPLTILSSLAGDSSHFTENVVNLGGTRPEWRAGAAQRWTFHRVRSCSRWRGTQSNREGL